MMPLTVIPMTINTMSCIALWISQLSLTAKIIITTLTVLKYAVFFYTALVCEVGTKKYFGITLCSVLNIGIIVYLIIQAQWNIIIGFAVCLLLLIVWTLAAVLNFDKKEGNEQ